MPSEQEDVRKFVESCENHSLPETPPTAFNAHSLRFACCLVHRTVHSSCGTSIPAFLQHPATASRVNLYHSLPLASFNTHHFNKLTKFRSCALENGCYASIRRQSSAFLEPLDYQD